MCVQDVYHKGEESFANGTNDREACPKRWIAVLVQMNCEKKTATQLGKAGYETYIPIQQEIHQWSDRKKKVNRLIMPMVVFVRATVNEEEWLRSQSYIFKLLALPGTDEDKKKFATPIPDYQIERLKFLLEKAESEVTIVANLTIGNAVRVIFGPLKGLEGVVSEADNKSSIVGVMIDGLGYACVKILKTNIRKIIGISKPTWGTGGGQPPAFPCNNCATGIKRGRFFSPAIAVCRIFVIFAG